MRLNRLKASCFARFSIVGLTAGLGAVASPVAGQTAPRAVALSGAAAPAGGNYVTFGTPVLNALGQVFFGGALTGGTSTEGIFAGAPGSLEAVILVGEAAPAGGNYSDIGGVYSLNESGQVGFFAPLTGSSANSGIFVGAPGLVQTVALDGAAAPVGGNYNGLLATNPVLNDAGKVAFVALTSNSPSLALFVGGPGSVQAAASRGQIAPAGVTFFRFDPPTLNAAGQVAFRAGLTGGAPTRGIFVGAPGALQAVAIQGDAAPAGGNYNDFANPVLNNAGQVAFRSTLTGGTSTEGIFGGTPGSIQAAALKGAAAPAGGNYNSLGNPVLSGTGQLGFAATLTGGSSTGGLFIGTPDSIQAAALGGMPAPAGGNFNGFGSPVMNGNGQAAFFAGLTGPGITAANNLALFAGSPGNLVQVVREGDVIDVDPGLGIDLRTVGDDDIVFSAGLLSGGQDGRGMTFNDAGLLVYRLTFTDNSSGIFTSVVPEPGVCGFAVFVVAARMMTRRRRR